MNKQRIWTKRACALGLAVATVLAAGEARAEYVENSMAESFAGLTLGIGMPVALGFDLACTLYLADAVEGPAVGYVGGIGSLAAGSARVATSALALTMGGEGNIPEGSSQGEEADALTNTRVMSGVGFAMAATSYALGIATLVSIHDDPDSSGPFDDHAIRWRLAPVPMGEDGGGMLLVGSF